MNIKSGLSPVVLMLIIALLALGTTVQAQKKDKKKEDDKSLNDFELKERKAAFMDANKQKLLGNPEEAAELYRKAIKIDPKHDASMFELARIYQYQNRLDDAIVLVNDAIEINNNISWYYLLLSDLYKENREYEKVVDVFNRLIAKFPNKIEYRYELAHILTVLGEYKDAIECYEQIEDIIGISEEVSLKKRTLWTNLGKENKALNEIELLAEAYPGSIRYLQILAETYVKMGDYDKALATYTQVVELAPDDPYIHIALSDLYRQKGNDEKSYEELKIGFANPELDLDTKIQILVTYYSYDQIFNVKADQAMELAEILNRAHPGDSRTLSLYGDLLYKMARSEEALVIINQLLALDPGKYAAWEQKIFIENELGENEQVIKSCKETSELFPMQPVPYLMLGFAQSQQKNYNEAIDALETGAKLVVGNNLLLAQFYSTLGDTYNQKKNFEKSDENYEKALTLSPNDAFVLNNYSYYLSLRNSQLEKARTMAAKATELKPESASFMDTYGWVLYKLGEYEEAASWIKKSIDHPDKDSGTVLEHYGDALYKLGRKADALEFWKRARENGEGVSEYLEKKINDQKLYE